MLARALLSLRAAYSSAGPLAARSFSDAAAAAAAPASRGAEPDGAKGKLFKILREAREPLTSAQIWEAAEREGLPSKRFTKKMLQELKDNGWVKTQPLVHVGKKHRNFGYRLNMLRQQQQQARLEHRTARPAAVDTVAAAVAGPA